MANDKPTNQRMGFGYSQARAAGLGGVRASRSPNQVNKLVKESKSNREYTRLLRIQMRIDPEWRQLIELRISEGHAPQTIYEEIRSIEHYAWTHRRKRL